MTPAGKVTELICNVDDMTPEAIGLAIDRLMECGALDAFVTPVVMKKGRPGHMITVLCPEDSAAEMAGHIFENTTTIGIRRVLCERYVLEREMFTVTTPYGEVRVKRSHGYGTDKRKPEFDDCARLSRIKGILFDEIHRAAEQAAYEYCCKP